MIYRNDEYWEEKMKFFLHDPVDKAFSIPGHEERAKIIADALGTTTAEKNEIIKPDVTAAGFDRARLPGFSSDPQKNGAVDFRESPILTHPLVKNHLKFNAIKATANETTKAVVAAINLDTADISMNRSEYFTYLFFMLKKSLVVKNAAGLGFLWERLPADTRMPDHSIWTHCSLVSALKTCFSESTQKQASLVIFSITPVQPFIEKTRKLKDHWTASFLLSWLSFEGINAVMDILGPDHLLYPSLDNQPFVNWSLKQKFNPVIRRILDVYEELLPLKSDKRVASLPNKFVFLAPAGKEKEMVTLVEQQVNTAWQELCSLVETFLLKYIGKGSEEQVHKQFTRQANTYWNLNHSFNRLISVADQNDIEKLFEKEKFKTVFNTIREFSKGYAIDTIYPVTHSLAQSVLAVAKTKPEIQRQEEPGKKCPVCGEFEVLHDRETSADSSVSQYRDSRDSFWTKIGDELGEVTIKSGEHLCAICTIKRLAPRAIREYGKGHMLYPVFSNHDFPSTTEVAGHEFFDCLEQENLLGEMKDQLADELHDRERKDYSPEIQRLMDKAKEKNILLKEQDKYYAILVMDGDSMGDLVNGETLSATWKEVLHPNLAEKFGRPGFPQGILGKFLDEKRFVSPAVHGAISEALGYFSLYAVPRIIKDHQGHLIYAGGDDVAAVLPLSRAFDAALEISRLYRCGFVRYENDAIKPCPKTQKLTDQFIFFLGEGEKITISGAILICHHKQPLRGAIEDAHTLLKEVAKKKYKKNAFAVKLQKRSGHSRAFASRWQEKNIFSNEQCLVSDSFREILKASQDELLSTSLIYRLEENLKFPVISIAGKTEQLTKDNIGKILRLIAYEVGHTGLLNKKYPGNQNQEKRRKEAMRLAGHIAGLVLRWDKEKEKNGAWEFRSDATEMAVFLSKGGMKS